MDITINGVVETISADDVAAYVRDKGLPPKTVVVELNGQVIVSDRWADTPLHDGDRMEVLNFVGGG